MSWWYVYALFDRQNDRFYIGMTNDLHRRIAEHRSGKTVTTHRMKSPELIYVEASRDKSDAIHRERQLKTGYGRRYLRQRVMNNLRA